MDALTTQETAQISGVDRLAAELANPELRDRLPELMRQIATLLSAQDLAALIVNFAGRRVALPSRPNGRSKLAKCISPEGRNALSAWRGGEAIHVPLCADAQTWLIEQRVLALRAAGHSVSSVAERVRLGERRVYAIMARYRGTKRPPRTISHRQLTATKRIKR